MSTTQETRTIKVFTSKGAKTVITTDASVWGDLIPHLENDFDLSNLQAAESVGKTTLVHRDAVLPSGDFILFLRPVKTKSGVDYEDMSYSELRDRLTETDKRDFLSVYGINFTQASKAQLIEFFTDFQDVVEEDENTSNDLRTTALVSFATSLLTAALGVLEQIHVKDEDKEEGEEEGEDFFTEDEREDLEDLMSGF